MISAVCTGSAKLCSPARAAVDKIGAGPFAGLTITANILMSLAIDNFGLFGIEQHSLNIWRILGAAMMTGGIVLIALF